MASIIMNNKSITIPKSFRCVHIRTIPYTDDGGDARWENHIFVDNTSGVQDIYNYVADATNTTLIPGVTLFAGWRKSNNRYVMITDANVKGYVCYGDGSESVPITVNTKYSNNRFYVFEK